MRADERIAIAITAGAGGRLAGFWIRTSRRVQQTWEIIWKPWEIIWTPKLIQQA